MTLIFKASTDDVERGKWRAQANNAAAHMKKVQDWGAQSIFQPAFVFDDGLVKLKIDMALIQRLNEQALADFVFEAVLKSAITPAGGESDAAAVTAPVMELGLSAAQASQAPAAAEVSEPCMRRVEPDFTQPCPNAAAGGLVITLRPAQTIEQRWGKHSLLTFVMDLTVCKDCLPKVQIMEITDQELRAAIGKEAQRMNNGVLVDWKRTLIEGLAFDDPRYLALRRETKKRVAANDSQPEAATDGRE